MPGFLPFAHATFMMDVIVLAMVAVLPCLAFSIWLVVVQKNYKAHMRWQVSLGVLLAVAVVAFAVEIRLYEWQHLMTGSPYFETSLPLILYIHRTFSLLTSVLWVATLSSAWMAFPRPPRPSPFSRAHRFLGWLATGGMFATAITGWIFYYLAFVAR